MKEHKKPKNSTLLHIIVMIPTLFLGIGLLKNSVDLVGLHNLYANGNFVKEYATIVSYDVRTRYRATWYTTYYKFEAEDGTIYRGWWERHLKTEEEAKAQIGKKVPIYVDHELKLQGGSDLYPIGGAWFNGIAGTLCLGLFLNSLIHEILYIVKWSKYKAALKK